MTSERRLELQRKLAEQVGWTNIEAGTADDLDGQQLFGTPPEDPYKVLFGVATNIHIPTYVLDPWDMIEECGMELHWRTTTIREWYAVSISTSVASNSHLKPQDAVFELYCMLKGLA